jgi:hypothetical protein
LGLELTIKTCDYQSLPGMAPALGISKQVLMLEYNRQ